MFCGIHTCPLLPYGNKVNATCYEKALEYYEYMGITLSSRAIKTPTEILSVFETIVYFK
jgi:hypothetical protein